MRATAILGLVRRLLTHEAAENQDQEALTEAAERVSDKLRAHLSRRIGQEGFRTLLTRALTLTIPQFPHLSAVRVEADGSLVGLRTPAADFQEREARQDILEGAVALVTHLLALLFTFIGEDLTLRILGAVWPGLASDDPTGWENERP